MRGGVSPIGAVKPRPRLLLLSIKWSSDGQAAEQREGIPPIDRLLDKAADLAVDRWLSE
jgi:hypothetical protein